MKLIDKDVLAAEIRRRQKIHFNDYHINNNNSPADYGACNALTQILAFINTLEVKEIDLEKYYQDFLQKEWFDKNCNRTTSEMMFFTAKHFFELGLKAQKGE